MPLLCKGCGQPLVVPEISTAEPEPVPPPPPPVVALPKQKPVPVPIPPPPPEPEPEPEAELPPVEPPPQVERPKPPKKRRQSDPVPQSTPQPEPQRERKKLLPVVADVAVGLLLLAIGVLLGEMLAKKPTAQVWHDAGGAVKFPPEELILWMGPPALISLVYGLLVSKKISVGSWLKRRAEKSFQ